ncbi:SDR family NAD(P)-dependent oxidoreductase [Tenggerimyces flavus]|uniref:SDR family NAD(P)-dependent oxidoreductase n=1 Tax=Tenggerimyces flavus TaxID=1708749 RepID=A0ABV7YAA1_9ACTN|nr:SDR family NAD(P)-dependent oxidoreductase [Tenggerimyces flavus]MBM7783750.1 NAD(P)-dependent dehydrogenase (short-subunit alcohol dehydrogenase family) [Tenggerimyces flavus]
MSIWFVTGASRGLGRALTAAALEAGHDVVATARTPAQLDSLAVLYPNSLRTLALDVTDPAAVSAAIATTLSWHGRVDVVVNNAGYANIAPVETMDPADFRAQLEANFFGTVSVTRAVLPTMRAQRSGHVLQISSIGGRAGAPGVSAYQAAKWAVEGFSEALAAEVAPFGVKLTIVEPGAMRTDWAGSSMRIDPLPAEYEATVGQLAAHLRRVNGREPIDPQLAARAIVHLTTADNPPLRLLIGTDAADIAAVVATRRATEDAAWDSVARSVDFPDASHSDWQQVDSLAENYRR